MKDNEQSQRRLKWHAIFDEYQKSGMTQKAFCEQHNLSLPQLVYYCGKFKRANEQSSGKPTFVPVKVLTKDKCVTSSEIKLSLPNGFHFTFQSHIDTSQIKNLVEVLLSC